MSQAYPDMTCVTGLLGCQWNQHEKIDSSPVYDLLWFGLYILISVFVLLWTFFWIVFGNCEDLINWYAYQNTGTWYPFYSLMLVLTCITLAYIVLLGVLAMCHIKYRYHLQMHRIHKTILVVILLMCSLAAVCISDVWWSGWSLIHQSFMIFGPFLHVVVVAVMTFLSWFIAERWTLLRKTGAQIVWIGLFISIMIMLYIFPMFISFPCVVDLAALPSKPRIMAHRGASATSPENTIIAFQNAARLKNVIALETDVSISYDGVPFILHDTKLTRTTNVRTVFPDKADLEACRFTISQLQQLDTGSWLYLRDPFRTTGSMSEQELKHFSNQTVILLRDVLDIAHKYNKSVMFDIKFDCEDHPHRDDYGEIIVQTLRNHRLSNDKIWWLSINRNISGSDVFTSVWDELEPVEYLLNKRVKRVNLNFDKLFYFKDMQSNNISMNLYVINAKWLYSLYWCMGLQSVTSDQVLMFDQMDNPIWRLSPSAFMIMWTTTDILSAVIIIVIFAMLRLVLRNYQSGACGFLALSYSLLSLTSEDCTCTCHIDVTYPNVAL